MGNRWLRGCAWVVEKAESYNSRSLGAVEGRKKEIAREFWGSRFAQSPFELNKIRA